MTYLQTLSFIHGTYGKGRKSGLDNMKAMLSRLGNPHEKIRCLHVAGTNGKGSICAYLLFALRACGYHVGLYTSPFLQRYNERMRVDGMSISDDALAMHGTTVAYVVNELRNEGILPTEFEIGTAIALLYFAHEKVDFAIIEVGLGGRLDPTNIITPIVSIIARIGLDHVKVLGDTLPQIAWEKAGIVKAHTPVVLYPQGEEVIRVVEDVCSEKEAPLFVVREKDIMAKHEINDRQSFTLDMGENTWNIEIAMQGKHQVSNAATALAALGVLIDLGVNLPMEHVQKGFLHACWPGRLEWHDNVLLDGAHNPQAARVLKEYLAGRKKREETTLLCGILNTKDIEGIAAELSQVAVQAVVTSPDSQKGADVSQLATHFKEKGLHITILPSMEEALQEAQKIAGEGTIVVSGSLYLVGAVRTMLGLSGEYLGA